METLVTFLHIVFIALFCWWYWRKQDLPFRKFYWHALAAKFSAGVLVGVIYGSSYATSDTFTMFEWSKELSLQARTDFFGYLNYLWSGGPQGYFEGVERTLFFVKIISIFALLTNDNYWISSLYLSLFSFLAAWKLTKIIWFNAPRLGIPAAIAFLFFPSCVFWASGVIKESVAMAGLFFLGALFLQVWWKQKLPLLDIVCGVIAVWVVWNLKYYYIGLFVPILLATWITRKVMETRKIDRYSTEVAIWFSILLVLVFIGSFTHPNFSLHEILNVLVSNNITSTEVSKPENIIHFYKLESTWLSVVVNSPWALISGFFRPFVWEANTVLKFFVSIENLVMLVLTVMSFRSIGEMKNSPHRLLILALLVYSIVLCVLLAISTPNFGTLVRYRIGFLPFFLVILVNRPVVVRALAKSFNVDMPGLSR
jgi:hypothetical protein